MEDIFPPTPLYIIYFIDRALLWINQGMYKSDLLLESLRPYCAKAEYQNRSNGLANRNNRHAIHLSQPIPMAFEILSNHNGVGKVFELELACDFIFDLQSEAEEFENWMRSHMVELWRGKKQVCNFEGTRYSGNRDANQTAMYSSRLSKIENKPCVHLEWRLKGARAVAAAKLDIYALSKIDNCAHDAFWNRRIRFVQVDLTKLGRIVRKRTRKDGRYLKEWVESKSYGVHKNVTSLDHLYLAGNYFKRAYGVDNEGNFDLQKLIDALKKFYQVDSTKFTNTLECQP